MNKKFSLIMAAFLFAGCISNAAENSYYTADLIEPSTNATLKNKVITVPAGEKIQALAAMTISPETLKQGENVQLILGTDFYYNKNLIAPAGSTVTGSVLESVKAGSGSMNGRLTMRFTQLITPSGIQIPISAITKTGGDKVSISANSGVELTLVQPITVNPAIYTTNY